MSNVAKTISKLDYFPIPHVFYINGNEGFRSVSGGFITIIMVCSFIYILYIQTYEYFNTDNPNELTKKERYANYSVNFTQNDFFLAVSLSFDDEIDFDYENYIKVGRIIHDNSINHANHNYQDNDKIYFTNCTKIDFSQYDISDSMKEKIIKNAKCLIFDDFNMKTSEFSGKTTLEITIYYDSNFAYNIAGYSYSDPSKPFKLTLYYQNLISAPSTFNENPIKKTIYVDNQYVYTYVNTEYLSTIKTFTSIRKGDFLRNAKNKKNFTYYYMDSFDVSQGLFVANTASNDKYFNRIFSYRIILDDTKEVHILTYLSLFDVFSSLGGTLNVILALAHIIFGWLQKFEQTKYIINRCFNNDSLFDKTGVIKKRKAESVKGILRTRSISKNTLVDSSNFENNKNSFVKKYTEDKDKNSKENPSDKARRSLKCPPLQNNFLSKTINTVNEDSDIKKSQTVKLSSIEKNKLLNTSIRSEKHHAQLSFFFFKSENSPYTKLFQMFLGLENIIKWNEEWIAYKALIMSRNMQIIFKYIDLNKLYINEKTIKAFKKDQEEFINAWSNITEVNDDEERKYIDKLEEIIEPFLMK